MSTRSSLWHMSKKRHAPLIMWRSTRVISISVLEKEPTAWYFMIYYVKNASKAASPSYIPSGFISDAVWTCKISFQKKTQVTKNDSLPLTFPHLFPPTYPSAPVSVLLSVLNLVTLHKKSINSPLSSDSLKNPYSSATS